MWVGYIGPGDEQVLASVLGPGCTIQSGSRFALGIPRAHHRSTALAVEATGTVTATHGDAQFAGACASIDPAGRGGRPTVTLCRDPFGVHGAFTTELAGTSWFASDPRLLRRVPGVSASLDPAALHGYLSFSHVPLPCSITTGMRALLPGERLTLTPHGRIAEPGACWQEEEPFAGTQDEAVTQLGARLQAVVQSRLGSAREVGVFLSGGLDSSLIAALLAAAGARVHLFTLDFGLPGNADVDCAERVAHHLQQPLHVLHVGPREIARALEPTAMALHQPFGDGVTVPLYLLGKAAAQEVDTIFNGEGGDQLFGGWANKPMIAAELHGGEGYDRLSAYLETYHRFHGREDQLYTPTARAMLGELDAADWVRPFLERTGFETLLHRLRAANLWLKGAQNIAPRAAQLAEVHGLTMHAPFFDRELAEWSFTLPPDWLLQGSCEKYILKRVAERFLPSDIVWREKQGMSVPTTDWCLGGLRRELGHWLAPRRIKERGWLDPACVGRLRQGEDQLGEYRRRRVGERLWTLLMLHVWCAMQDPPLTWPALEVEATPEPARQTWWDRRTINPFALGQSAWLRVGWSKGSAGGDR